MPHWWPTSLLGSGGALVPLRSYTENAGVFFESRAKAYGLLNNCNTWTGEALRSAGLPVKSAFNLTSRSIFEQAQAITRMQSPAPAAAGGVTPALAHYWRFWPGFESSAIG
ncbi:MAG: DUF2459 domain-containing protein [Haliea sp.]|nr:DUF2459 domain-containing protein [Haliea sp.]